MVKYSNFSSQIFGKPDLVFRKLTISLKVIPVGKTGKNIVYIEVVMEIFFKVTDLKNKCSTK